MTDKMNLDGRAFLEQVKTQLQARLEELDSQLARGQQEIAGMHEYYWENYTEMDQYGYEDYDNQQALLGQVAIALRKCWIPPSLGGWIFSMRGRRSRRTFILVSEILPGRRGCVR